MTGHAPTGDRPDHGGAMLYLLVGLLASGKTTRAKEIASARPALRLTPDEWILALYGDALDRPRRDAVRERVETVQWRVAQRARSAATSSSTGASGRASSARRIGGGPRRPGRGCGCSSSTRAPPITRSDLARWSTMLEPPAEEELV